MICGTIQPIKQKTNAPVLVAPERGGADGEPRQPHLNGLRQLLSNLYGSTRTHPVSSVDIRCQPPSARVGGGRFAVSQPA